MGKGLSIKKIVGVIVVLLLLNLVILVTLLARTNATLGITYYYDVNDARRTTEFYDEAEYLFTWDLDEVVIDFAMKDDELRVVEMLTKDADTNVKYRIKGSRVFSIEREIDRFHQMPEYHWDNSAQRLKIQYAWCIVSKEFNDANGQFSAYEFNYEGTPYCLCYQTVAQNVI